jgi:hypothetical protein
VLLSVDSEGCASDLEAMGPGTRSAWREIGARSPSRLTPRKVAVPGSLSGLLVWAAETAGSEPGSRRGVRAGFPRRHYDAYLPGSGNRLALLPGSSGTAAGTPKPVPMSLPAI